MCQETGELHGIRLLISRQNPDHYHLTDPKPACGILEGVQNRLSGTAPTGTTENTKVQTWTKKKMQKLSLETFQPKTIRELLVLNGNQLRPVIRLLKGTTTC
jgi:hypothetical protein